MASETDHGEALAGAHARCNPHHRDTTSDRATSLLRPRLTLTSVLCPRPSVLPGATRDSSGLNEVLQEVGRTGRSAGGAHSTRLPAMLPLPRCVPCSRRLTAGAASPRRVRADISGRRWCP